MLVYAFTGRGDDRVGRVCLREDENLGAQPLGKGVVVATTLSREDNNTVEVCMYGDGFSLL